MRKLLKYLWRTLLVAFVALNAISAFHAWKFTHFYADGKPHKGADQLDAGEKIKAMFFGMKVPNPKIGSPLPLPHDTILFTTVDALTIEGWYASQANAKGCIALFHGHLATKSAIISEAMAFYKMGYNVFMIDFRGHGNSTGDYCTIGYKEAEEVKLAYDFLVEKGEKKIFLWGVSMGAAAITSAFNTYDIHPKGVILELPYGSLLQAVEARTKMMGLPKQPVASLLTFWGGIENGFNAFALKPEVYAKKINCPVLLQAGAIDNRVSMSEIDNIFNNLASTKKQKVVYETSGHQSLLQKEPEKWLKTVNSFLLAH